MARCSNIKKRIFRVLLCFIGLSINLFSLYGIDRIEPVSVSKTEQDVLNAYNQASEIVAAFKIGPLPLNYRSPLQKGNAIYYPVLKFTTMQQLSEYLLSLFSPELSKQLLNSGFYVEFGGVLYSQGGERGSSIRFGNETYQVRLVNANYYILSVTVEILNTESVNEEDPDFAVIGFETFYYNYQKTASAWVFTSFPFFR